MNTTIVSKDSQQSRDVFFLQTFLTSIQQIDSCSIISTSKRIRVSSPVRNTLAFQKFAYAMSGKSLTIENRASFFARKTAVLESSMNKKNAHSNNHEDCCEYFHVINHL
ncbi:hypothetical protein CEXT_197341 [Caerostris extrusa]|uniref:Uncharacterized protein n=1 Tax=Caerostris extrusa TaxID=172846 RepID=A0AAV4MYU8_CAEEX|nr:hypothetical protein CEXT_197341 [Caerostris extrusa]